MKRAVPNMYEGKFRVVPATTGRCSPSLIPSRYLEFIGEHVEPWSYLKFPFFKPQGYPEGCYRVGPLGRLNAADAMSTPRADEELRAVSGVWPATGLKGGTLLFHYARMIELL